MKFIKNLIKYIMIKNKDNLICFYSESSFYTNYYLDLAKALKINGENLLILTSCLKEYNKLKKDFEIIFIGDGFFRYLIFNILKSKCLIMTLTDIGNNLFKSKFCKSYIYYFHAMASTHKIYTNTAFDNYDIILSLGDFQNKEIRIREKKFNLKRKKIYNTGYFYLDYLKKNTNKGSSKEDIILFAPSWNYNNKNLLNDHGDNIIKELISQNLKVIFRPHPQNFLKNKEIIENINKKYSSNSYTLDQSPSNIRSMEEAGSLVTDNSAISLEYSFNFHRPVFFIDYSDKIHNKNYLDIDLEPIENLFKKNIGFNLKLSEINLVEKNIKKFYKNINHYKNLDEEFLNENYFYNNDSVQKTLYMFKKDNLIQ
jgi:hypothetical protein